MMNSPPIARAKRVDNRFLSRLVILMFIVAVLLAVLFGIYYYVDRYVRFGDQSPVELEIKRLETVIVSNPEDLGARLAIAQLHFEDGDYSKAIQYAEPVLKAHPDDPAPLFLLGVVYSESGQLESAVESLEHLIDIRRQSPMAQVDQVLQASLYYLGVNYLKLNQIDLATKVLREALVIDKTDADAFYQLGIAYTLNGDYERSIEAFQDAVRFVPDFTEAYQGMVTAYEAIGMSSNALYARGMTAYSLKDYRQARQFLEQAAQDLPDFIPLFLGLALTYEQQGNFELAWKNIQRVLELEPDNFNANVIAGRLGSVNRDS